MPIAICLWIVSVLFGGLSLLAALVQWKSERKALPALLMAAGAVLLLAAVGCNMWGRRLDVLLALVGCAAVCATAVWNGLKSGRFHLSHHILRAAVSAALLTGFALL